MIMYVDGVDACNSGDAIPHYDLHESQEKSGLFFTRTGQVLKLWYATLRRRILSKSRLKSTRANG